MSNVVNLITPAAEHKARATLLRLETIKPSEACALTDEDLAIFGMFFAQKGKQFDFYIKAAYLEYFVFFSGAVAVAATEAAEIIGGE